jgi:penicillin-binding protein 2
MGLTTCRSFPALIFRVILVVGFAILATRLAELTVIKGAYFQELAEGNRIRRVPIEASRGEIHARGGELLVNSVKEVGKLKFDRDVGFEIVEEPGVDESTEDAYVSWIRKYYLGEKLGHVTGYIGEVNEEEVNRVDPKCPEKGVRSIHTLIGKTGLEETYQCKLAGADGEELFEVDAKGELIRRLGRREAVPGENIVTNIDFGLQEKVYEAMHGKAGVVIATDPEGEVLALYSSPSFDPNVFIEGDNSKIAELLKDAAKPFFDRAIAGLYHPGSVFKPFVAIAALTEGVIDEEFRYEDTGRVVVKTDVGDFSYANWYFTQYGGVEGSIGLVKALARSTDTFFYKIGEFLGVEKIALWAKRFGLQGPTGIDLPGEAQGLVPSPEWKREVKGESWFLGNTYHMSIGQGDLAVTPLSINAATASLVSGKYCPPRVVGKAPCRDMDVDERDLETVLKGMKAVCSEGGTASVFFDWRKDDLGEVACKTGTAETGINDKTHAWFSVIAPVGLESSQKGSEEDQIIMTVLVEEGGEGSQVAAPIARELLDYWFNR